MAGKIVWTDGQDAQIRRFRTEGASCEVIALVLGRAAAAVAERAKKLGVDHKPVTDLDQPDRPPLPPGHPRTWGAIVRGSLLRDEPYQTSDLIR